MQDRMALCFHGVFLGQPPSYCVPLSFMFTWKTFTARHLDAYFEYKGQGAMGILGLEQWLGRQCCLGWPVCSGKLTLSLVIKNRIQMASRGAEGNNDRHQQAFVRKNRRGGWHEALQMSSWNTRWEADQLGLFGKGSKGMNRQRAIVFEDRHPFFFPMELWKSMCSVDPSSACKWIYGDEWFEKWKTIWRECA